MEYEQKQITVIQDKKGFEYDKQVKLDQSKEFIYKRTKEIS